MQGLLITTASDPKQLHTIIIKCVPAIVAATRYPLFPFATAIGVVKRLLTFAANALLNNVI